MWTRINNDSNGNPRYVCHFLHLNTQEEKDGNKSITELYNLALRRAKKWHGKKYHNRSYGGGIVFTTYNLECLETEIKECTK